MVTVHASAASPDAVDVVITYHSSAPEPIYCSADANDWQPQQMKLQGDAYEHVITVPRSTRRILYKFRIGDSNWFHDDAVNAVPDGFFGWNNNYDLPDADKLPKPITQSHPANDFDEDTEVESVAAVESIADTASEASADDLRSNGEPELIDVDDVIGDPDYPGTPDHFLTKEQNASTRRDRKVPDEGVEQRASSNFLFGFSIFGVVAAGVVWFWLAK